MSSTTTTTTTTTTQAAQQQQRRQLRHKCLAQQQQRRQLRHKLHNVLLIPFTVNFEGPLKFDRIDFYRKTFLVHSSRDCCSGLRRR